jgi:hypothetical protein
LPLPRTDPEDLEREHGVGPEARIAEDDRRIEALSLARARESLGS